MHISLLKVLRNSAAKKKKKAEKIVLNIVYAKISQNYLTKECFLFFVSFQLSFQSNSLADHRNNALQRKPQEMLSWKKESFIQWMDGVMSP